MAVTDQELQNARIAEARAKEAADEKKRLDDMAIIQQVQHPDIGWAERPLLENLASSPEAAVGYLQKKLGTDKYDYKITDTGQVALRTKSQDPNAPYQVIDPQTGIDPRTLEGWGELGKDIVGGASTIAKGIASGVGAAGAAPLGIPAGPVGMLGAGAIGAAGGASAAEMASQGLGSMLGIPNNYSGENIQNEALGAAIATPFTGTGMNAKQLGALAKETGLTVEALKKMQQGLVGRAWDATGKIRNKLGEAMSGVGEDVLEYTKNNLPWLKKVLKEDSPELSIVREVRKETAEKFHPQKEALWGEMDRRIKEAPADPAINVKPYREQLQRYIDELKAEKPTKEYKEAIKQTEELRDTLFGKAITTTEEIFDPAVGTKTVTNTTVPSDIVSPQEAYRLKKVFDAESDISHVTGNNMKPRFGGATSRLDKDYAMKMDKIRKDLSEKVAEATGTQDLNKQYSQMLDDQKFIAGYNASDKSVGNKLKGLFTRANNIDKQRVREIDKRYGTNIENYAKQLAAISDLGRPGLFAKSSEGTVSTGRVGAAGGLGATLGGIVAAKLGINPYIGGGLGFTGGAMLGGPAAMKRYMQAGKGIGAATDKLKNVYVTPQGLFQPASQEVIKNYRSK